MIEAPAPESRLSVAAILVSLVLLAIGGALMVFGTRWSLGILGDPIAEIRTGFAPAELRPGQQVTVTVPRAQLGGYAAFWTNVQGREVLAVVNRDNRSAQQHAFSLPSSSPLGDLPAAPTLTFSGTIERIPYAEAAFSWQLTEPELRRVERDGVYARLTQVAAADQGAAAPASETTVDPVRQ